MPLENVAAALAIIGALASLVAYVLSLGQKLGALAKSISDSEDYDTRLRVLENVVPALAAKDQVRENEIQRLEERFEARLDRLEAKIDELLTRGSK